MPGLGKFILQNKIFTTNNINNIKSLRLFIICYCCFIQCKCSAWMQHCPCGVFSLALNRARCKKYGLVATHKNVRRCRVIIFLLVHVLRMSTAQGFCRPYGAATLSGIMNTNISQSERTMVGDLQKACSD